MGRYRLGVECGTGEESRTWFAPEVVTVEGGRTSEATFHIERVPLVVRLLDRAGQPLVERTLRWTVKAGSRGHATWWYGQARTDAEGRARLDPAPALHATFALREPETSDAEWARLDAAEQKRRTLELGAVHAERNGDELRGELRAPVGAPTPR